MYTSQGQQRKIGNLGIEINAGFEGATLQLKNKWPHLYDCIDWSRISESSFRTLDRLTSKASDFTSSTNGGRGEMYRQAQHDPLVRGVGIRQLFELVSPEQNLANLTPGHKILDVLGGDGVLARAMKKMTPPSLMPSIVSSDLSEEMVAAAQAYGLFSIRQTAQNLFLKDRTMEGVILAYGTHHIPMEHRLQVCREAFRVLAPGGRIVLHDFETGSPVSQWFNDVVGAYSMTGHAFPHFTPDEIREYLFAAGFVDIDVRYMYDPFVLRADSVGAAKRKLAEYLLNMYGLAKVVIEHGYDRALQLVYDLACQYFKYDYESAPYRRRLGQAQVNIGREKDCWYVEAPRVALVGSGTRPC